MASTYNRRINLYINGKEVSNDIKSVQAAMNKLRNEQRMMTIGSDEYVRHGQKIRNLKGIIDKHNADLRKTERSWFSLKGTADKFNKYFGIVTAAVASFTGVALTIKSATQEYARFDDKLADVMKTTGLTKEEVKDLNTELEKLDTRTSQEDLLGLARIGGKLGITGADEILGFVRAADQISVALGEDLGGAEEAIRELGKLTDIFKTKELFGQEEALLKIGSAINELGMASTANEAYLVEFSKRTAGIAPQAGVSIENILGLAATLDALGQKAEMSSTAYSKLMTTMTKKTAEFSSIAGMNIEDFSNLMETDANEAMIRVFEGISKTDGGFQQMVAVLGDLGVEGQRMTSVFGALANNTNMLREQQALSNKAFDEGISLTNEFNIKNNTAQATLEKARKEFTKIQRELGERLAPAYANVIKKGSTMIKVLATTVEFIFNHGRQLAILVLTIAAYTAATKLAVLWQQRQNTATLANIISQKLQALAFNAQFAAIALYNSAVALLTGRLKVAAIQFRAFSAAISANPIGIVVGAIVAAGTALYLYSKRLSASEKAQKSLNEINLDARKNIVEEKLEIERLMRVAQNDFRSKQDRIKAIERLKEIAPGYLDNLSLETINTDKAATAVEKYIKALEQKAKVQAAEEKLVEIEKELYDIQSGELSFWDKARAGGLAYASGLNFLYSETRNLRKEDELRTKRAAELNLQKEILLGISQQQVDLDKKNNSTPDTSDNSEDTGGAASSNFEKTKEALETAFQQEQLLLKEQLLQKKLTQEEYNHEMYILELSHLTAMRELYLQHNENFIQIEGQIIDKKLAWQQHLDSMFETSTQITNKLLEDERKMFADIDADMDKYMNDYQEKLDKETQATIDAEDKKREAREKAKEAQIEQAVQAGAAAVENAETVKDAAKGILNTIRQQIKAYIAEAVAVQALKALKSVPFPFNIAAAAIAGGTATFLFNKIIPEFATGKYPDMEYTGRPQTGMYGNKPHLGIFNEVRGYPEMVIDGITTKRIQADFPGIMNAIYDVRDGRKPKMYAEGKYPENTLTSSQQSSNTATQQNDNSIIISKLDEMITRIERIQPRVAIDKFEREREKYVKINKYSGM